MPRNLTKSLQVCGQSWQHYNPSQERAVYRVCPYPRVSDALVMPSAKLGSEFFKGGAVASHLESIHQQIKIQLLSLNAL